MNILITGMTTLQVGRPGQLQVESLPRIYTEALTELGHTVENRPHDPGESLDEFDLVLVGAASLVSVTSAYVYGGLDAIMRAPKLGFYVDDYRFSNTINSPRTIRNDPTRLLKPIMSGRRDFEWAVENLDWLAAAATALAERPWPNTLVPAFPWGDHDQFKQLPSRKLVVVDPSSFAMKHQMFMPERKKRSWVSAALTQKADLPYLDALEARMTWPIERLGNRGQREPRLKEPEVVQRYADSWGVLSLPHSRINGSGWWRVRFIHACRAGCVLMTDPGEVANLPESFHMKLEVIEQLRDDQLAELARTQYIDLGSRAWSREQFLEALQTYVTDLVCC